MVYIATALSGEVQLLHTAAAARVSYTASLLGHSTTSMDGHKKSLDEVRPVTSEENFGTIEKTDLADNEFEVFKKGEGVVDFRTVSWYHASMIFLKSELEHRIYITSRIC